MASRALSQTKGKGKGKSNHRSPLPVDTRQRELATRFGGTIVNGWDDMVFLVQEPNRYGNNVYHIRLIFGDLTPRRYGPFESEALAKKAFRVAREFVIEALDNIFYDIQDEKVADGDTGQIEIGQINVED